MQHNTTLAQISILWTSFKQTPINTNYRGWSERSYLIIGKITFAIEYSEVIKKWIVAKYLALEYYDALDKLYILTDLKTGTKYESFTLIYVCILALTSLNQL